MHPDHRTLRWLVLFGYVLVAAGVPLPAGSMAAGASRNSAAAKRLAGKDRSVPFPCMDSPCGCVTAEQCFESCCCHTPAELLAWATARNLSLDVLQGLKRRLEQAPPAVGGSCCGEATPEPVSCCEAAAACCDEVAPSCCDQVASCCDDAVVTAAAADACCGDHDLPAAVEVTPLSESVVVLQAMLACGGVVSEWLACAAAPLPVVLAVSPLERRGETVVSPDDVAVGVCCLLDPPPPRVG